jgi:Mrp family chromosome partitioning ATPase/capsular polysaccharide biosynthesis protein
VNESDPSILRYYLGIVWRWKWLVLVPLVVLPLVVLVLSVRQAPLYSGSADVLLNHQDQIATTIAGVETPPEDAGRYAVTQALVARSPVLVHRVLAAVGLPDTPPRVLIDRSAVVPNSDVLQFYVSNRDPELATRLANAYAREFASFRQELDTRDLRATVRSLDVRLQQLARDGKASSQNYARLATQQEQVRLIESLRRSSVYVIRTSASGDAVQLAPRPVHNTLLSIGAALVLGLLLVAVANAFDRRVFDPREIAAAVDAPLLARTEPHGRKLEGDDGLRVAALVHQAARAAAARSLLLASVGSGSRPHLAVALAEGFVQMEDRVVLVDADLRDGGVTRAYGLQDQKGLAELVRGDGTSVEPVGIAAPAGRGTLRVLAAGESASAAAPLLVAGATAATTVRDLVGEGDLVLVAGPPFGSAPESLALAASVDAMLLVIRPGVDRRALGETRRSLDVASTPILGFVLLDASDREPTVSRRRRVVARVRADANAAEPSELSVRSAAGEAPC